MSYSSPGVIPTLASTITVANGGNTTGLSVTQNDVTNNPSAVTIVNTGTNNAMTIDQNGATGTTKGTSGGVLIENTGNSGWGLQVYSNLSSMAQALAYMSLDHSSSTGQVLRLDNDGTGNGIRINDTGAKGSGDSTSGAILINMSHATNAGMVLNIKALNTATSHNLIRANSASAFTTTVSGAQTIDNTSTQVTVASTTGFPTSGTVRITNNTSATENARMVMIHYTSVDATHFIGTGGVFYKENTSINLIDLGLVDYLESTQTASIIESIDNSTNGGMVNLKLTGVNPDLEFVSKSGMDAANGEGKFEIDVPTGDNVNRIDTDVMRFNGRSDANSGFNTAMLITRPGLARQGLVAIGFQNLSAPTTVSAHLHIKNDTNFGDTNAPSLIGQIVQGASGQTADLFQARSHAGTVLASIGSDGSIRHPSSTPASAAATGTTGTITWDSSFIYVCTATNTWKRVAIATW